MASPAPFTFFMNAAGTNTGAILDLDTGIASWSIQVVASTGVTAGAVTVLGSLDGSTFTQLINSVQTGKTGTASSLAAGVLTFTAAGSAVISGPNAANSIRVLRADVTTLPVGGTISAIGLGR